MNTDTEPAPAPEDAMQMGPEMTMEERMWSAIEEIRYEQREIRADLDLAINYMQALAQHFCLKERVADLDAQIVARRGRRTDAE